MMTSIVVVVVRLSRLAEMRNVAMVIVHNSLRGKKEQDYGSRLSHIFQEDVVVDEVFHRRAVWCFPREEVEIFTWMLAHDKISAIANVEHPSYSTHKHCDRRLVDVREMSGCQENVSQYKYQHN